MALTKEQCFTKLSKIDVTALTEWLTEKAHTYEDWISLDALDFRYEMIPDIPNSKIFELCPQLELLHSVAPLREPVGFTIAKMNPGNHYALHKDTIRGVNLNILLEADSTDSVTVFVDDKHDNNIRLEYKPNTLYAFNTQVFHSVLNFSKPRYLFTSGFEKTREHFKYRDLLIALSKVELL